jgi:RNA methyltransferase, TrmH family
MGILQQRSQASMTAQDVKAIAQRCGRVAAEAGPGHEAAARARAAAKGALPGMLLVEGLWLNDRALEYDGKFEALYVCPELIRTQEWADKTASLIAHSEFTCIVSEKMYARLSADKSDAGLLSLVRLPQHALQDMPGGERSLVLVLDGLESPGNVGTLIRTAEGAGADAVLLCGARPSLQSPAVARASLCTQLSLPVVEAGAEEALSFLRARGYTLYLGKADAPARYCDTGYAQRAAIVVGHEKYGVSDAWTTQPHVALSIPMLGRVDSLNAAVAGGILLYEAARSHGFQ